MPLVPARAGASHSRRNTRLKDSRAMMSHRRQRRWRSLHRIKRTLLSLPDDILIRILEAAMEVDPKELERDPVQHNRPLRRALELSSICRQLRQLALDTPGLWNRIEVVRSKKYCTVLNSSYVTRNARLWEIAAIIFSRFVRIFESFEKVKNHRFLPN